ncbi:CAP domain-containing protein [Cohnella endophytica]|nr:CAP domain-containing protein [Cohnella endophytica]
MKRIGILGGVALVLLLVACGNRGNTRMNVKSNSNPMRLSSIETNQPVHIQTVRSNETLGDIARKYHVDIDELLRLNPDLAGLIGANPGTGAGTGNGAGGMGPGAGTGAGTNVGIPSNAVESPINQDRTVKLPAHDNLTGYEEQVLALTNEERKKAGLSACAGTDSNLNRSAKAKSEDMAAKNYFSHDSPTYGDPFAMMRNFGVQYQTAGENIAMGQPTPQEVVTAWMNSPGHRANILKAEYNYLGVGYVLKDGKAYWTQQFIGK